MFTPRVVVVDRLHVTNPLFGVEHAELFEQLWVRLVVEVTADRLWVVAMAVLLLLLLLMCHRGVARLLLLLLLDRGRGRVLLATAENCGRKREEKVSFRCSWNAVRNLQRLSRESLTCR